MLPGGLAVQHLGPKRGLGLGLLGSSLLLLALPFSIRMPALASRSGAGAAPQLVWAWICMCALGVMQAPLMPATSALQREWIPHSLGEERVWASKVPMFGMKLARVVAAVSVPALAASTGRLGWRAVGYVYATATAAVWALWQLKLRERVIDCSRLLTVVEHKLLASAPSVTQPRLSPPLLSNQLVKQPHISVATTNGLARWRAAAAVIIQHTNMSTINLTFAQWAPTVFLQTLRCSPAEAGPLLAIPAACDIAGHIVGGTYEAGLVRRGLSPAAVIVLPTVMIMHSACLNIHNSVANPIKKWISVANP
eukprot:SAG31_NODE_8831_length_1379_cov_1.441406_1_plen_308_part_10